ncbi:cullin domain-containing protein [Cryptosporidium canis]|uniref:Cullin domain-containing protein n=1 Tax=Cryptosporidium canis TaxID=195482 RepID=A0ABQ8P633_9CRYT|nr:cullin domain-containing protein [Cryptosporidium canis]
MIQLHELALAIKSQIQGEDGRMEPSDFIYSFLLGNSEVRERLGNDVLDDYLAVFAKFWCHHKRSTQIVCNVYLSFDYMYKRYRPGQSYSGRENEYQGFVQNANSFLKSIILDQSEDLSQAQMVDAMPVTLVAALVSAFTLLNEIKDLSLSSSSGCGTIQEGFREIVSSKYERTFFKIRKVFEMFISLDMVNGYLMMLYLDVLGSYYLRVLESKRALGFKEFIIFVKEALELEKSLLATPNNRDVLLIPEGGPESIQRTSLLSFIQHGHKLQIEESRDGSSLDDSSLLQSEEEETGWDTFALNVEHKVLDILLSDDILPHYSKINNGQSSLTALVDNEEFEMLMFLFKSFGKRGREHIFRKEFERCIVELGLQLVEQLTKYRCLDVSEMRDHERTSSVLESYLGSLRGLLELYLKIERIWKTSFMEDDKIRSLCMNDAWIQIMNSNDNLSKEIMRGLSVLTHHMLVKSYYFNQTESLSVPRSGGTQHFISRANLDIINWSIKHASSGDAVQGLAADSKPSTREYFESIIHLFRASNSKEHFQTFYHQLLSQRLIYHFTNNKLGFGGNQEEICRYYRGWASPPASESNLEMLTNKIDTFDIYLMKLLYNECGYTFINKSNFVIKDWFISQSIFKFYLMESIGFNLGPFMESLDVSSSEPLDSEEESGVLAFGDFSQRKRRITKSLNSSLCENIHSWLKSEDIKANFGASCWDGARFAENIQDGDLLISTGVPADIQKRLNMEEMKKEEVLRRIQYAAPFSIAVISSTSWPVRNLDACDGANNTGTSKKDKDALNFLECGLFVNSKGNSAVRGIQNELRLYEQFYTKIYSRTLTWSYFLGSCVLDYCMHAERRQRLQMILTLQQGVLLLCFNTADRVVLDRTQYSLLRDNLGRLFVSNVVLVDRSEVGERKEVELPPVLRLHEDEEQVQIEYNVDFDVAVGDFMGSSGSGEYMLDYVSNLPTVDFSSDFSLDYIYKERDYLDENRGVIERREGEGGEQLERGAHYGSQYDNLKSKNYISLFKSNKYRVEAIIMRFLKQKQESPLLNIIKVVMEELSLDDDENNDESIQDNKIINGEILKILSSLIRRDLIEVDSENEHIYHYIP